MVGNEEDCIQMDKCNLGEEEEEKELQDVVYLILKGILEKLIIKVQVITD